MKIAIGCNHIVKAQSLASALNQSAFNLTNALGA